LGEQFASGEGLQDALFACPARLYQTDEMDTLFRAIKQSSDGRYESLVAVLLSVYSAANTVWVKRSKAGQRQEVIDQPSLTIFGTAVPSHYYDALSSRFLTNGLFARLLVIHADKRHAGDPVLAPIPEPVLEAARWWAAFRPGSGNLDHWHPSPATVPYTPEAKELLAEGRHQADAEYARAEQRGDEIAMAQWARANEHARKLALVYAVSENHRQPEITRSAAEWAIRFVNHLVRKMLAQANAHVADNPFHKLCLKALEAIRMAGGALSQSALLQKLKISARMAGEITNTLEQQGLITTEVEATGGRPRRMFKLIGGDLP